MDAGSIALIVGGGLSLTGVIAWTIGFIRAVRRQPITDRLHEYCQRGG
jgi:hypothetical protein